MKTRSAPSKSRLRWLWHLAALLLVLLALAALLLFSQRQHILDWALTRCEARLAEAGIYLTHGAHQLRWVHHSLELENLTLYADSAHTRKVATFQNLQIQMPLSLLWRQRGTWRFSSNDSDLTLIAPEGPMTFDNVDLQLLLFERSLRIARLTTLHRGIRWRVHGELHWKKQAGQTKWQMPDLTPLQRAGDWLAFESGDPSLDLQLIPASDSTMASILIELTGKKVQWRQLHFDSIDAKGTLRKSGFDCEHFEITGYGGSASLTGQSITAERRLVIEDLQSTLDPFRFLRDLLHGHLPDRLKTLGEVRIRDGQLDLHLADTQRTTGKLPFEATDGISVPCATADLPLRDLRGRIEMKEGHWHLHAERLRLFEGNGQARFRMPYHSSTPFEIECQLESLAFPELCAAFGVDRWKGRLNVSFDGGGGETLESLQGNGTVSIREADLYTIPMLNLVQAVMKREFPIFGKDTATDLDAQFHLKDASLTSEDVRIESASSRVNAKVRYQVEREYLDATVTGRLKGVPGIALTPLTAVLELKGAGPIDDVKWHVTSRIKPPEGLLEKLNPF